MLDGDGISHAPNENLNDNHESRGYQFLLRHFGSAVADPVRLHVLAKRYLCTQHPDYEQRLSPTSRQSYYDQGGPMSAAEVAAFEAEPYFRDALRLRSWDDAAKNPAIDAGNIDEYGEYLSRGLGTANSIRLGPRRRRSD
jgi:predicted HD phosphohydrolase